MSQNWVFNKIDKEFLLSFLSWKHIHPLILLDNVFTIKGLPISVKAQGGHGGHGALPQGTWSLAESLSYYKSWWRCCPLALSLGNSSNSKGHCRGFPGDSVVKNLPASAGDTDSISDPGRSHVPRSNSAHALLLLSLGARTTEPTCCSCLSPHALRLVICSMRSPCDEKPVHHN